MSGVKKLKRGITTQSGLQLGYPDLPANKNTIQASHNACIGDRDRRNFNCIFNPSDSYCQGHNNGKELDRCMASVWNPVEQAALRPQGGKPYDSFAGDKCFDFYVERYEKYGMSKAESAVLWEDCLYKNV